jgi:hypothetical protein
MTDIKISVHGLEQLERKLGPDLINGPVRDMFNRAGEEYLNFGKVRSPVDTGLMRSTLAKGANNGIFELDTRVPPLFVKVGTSHVSRQGFPYPVALDESPRYHYRGGGAQGGAARGAPTQGWFTGIQALPSFLDRFREIIRGAERAIKARWERR